LYCGLLADAPVGSISLHWGEIVLLAMGAWNIVALLIPLAVVMIGFIYLPHMK
jgi:hypothetical protein